jgi:hypothetical protein
VQVLYSVMLTAESDQGIDLSHTPAVSVTNISAEYSSSIAPGVIKASAMGSAGHVAQ